MFTLPFEVNPSPFKLSTKDGFVLIGSCFTDNIGQKLNDYKFQSLSNPYGVIYNPISIFKLLRQSVDEDINMDGITQIEGIYYHWDMHSVVSSNSHHGIVEIIKRQQQTTRESLIKAKVLVMTPGTSFVYHRKDEKNLVANCHKVPQKSFIKSLLTTSEIKNSYQEMIKTIRSINPDLKVILTVSPVRHVKDGLAENNHSKAILLQAIHEIVSEDEQVSYFPAYEIVIDVLRDYRFYKEDLVHPNEQAIRHLWEVFIKTYLDTETQSFIGEWESMLKAINHRPFHPDSSSHQVFLRKTIEKLKKLGDKVDLTSELELLKSGLIKP